MSDTERMSEEQVAKRLGHIDALNNPYWAEPERLALVSLQAERALLTRYTDLGTPERFAALLREHEAIGEHEIYRCTDDDREVCEGHHDEPEGCEKCGMLILIAAYDAVEATCCPHYEGITCPHSGRECTLSAKREPCPFDVHKERNSAHIAAFFPGGDYTEPA